MAKIKIDAKAEYTSVEELKYLVEQINRYIVEITTEERANSWCSSSLYDTKRQHVGHIHIDLTTPVSEEQQRFSKWASDI